MSRLAIIKRDGLEFGLVSVPAYHRECHKMPCFTSREMRLLTQQAIAMGWPTQRRDDGQLVLARPLPIDILGALIEIKRVFPEATIDDKIRDWPPSWQWSPTDDQ